VAVRTRPGAAASNAVKPVAEKVVGRLPPQTRRVARALRQEDLFLLSAALAFYALVAVAPFAILVLWVVGLVAGDSRVHQAADQLARYLPPNLNAGHALEQVALLWPATAYGAGLSRAFDRMCPGADQPAKGLRGRALALALVGVMPALVLAGLVASYAGTKVLGHGVAAEVLGWPLALGFGFVAASAATALIYKLYSPRPIRGRGVVEGAAVAGAGVALLSVGYALYLHVGADFAHRYATSGLAAVVLLALWLFLVNALILVGYQVAQDEG
jgi:uncharacterized BrkB/YihY/UPF0761 family membrane protein